jgi:pimeloyl-ACP methyl ester carboxylesterase
MNVDLIDAPGRAVALDSGHSIQLVEAGAGPPVVLIHGLIATRHDMLIALGDGLARRFRMVAVDRPGHGDSTRPRLQGTPIAQATAIRSALQAIGVERPVLVGHSLGGAVALAYAVTWPDEIAGVVGLSSLVYPELRLEHLLFAPRATPVTGPLLSAFAAATSDALLLPMLYRHMFAPQPIPDLWRDRFPMELVRRPEALTTNGEDIALSPPALGLMSAGYGACRVPVHFLAGGADQVVDRRRHAALAAEHFPNARLTLLPGIGHMLHHFAPDAVEAAIDDVLARARGESRPPTPMERAFETRA